MINEFVENRLHKKMCVECIVNLVGDRTNIKHSPLPQQSVGALNSHSDSVICLVGLAHQICEISLLVATVWPAALSKYICLNIPATTRVFARHTLDNAPQ